MREKCPAVCGFGAFGGIDAKKCWAQGELNYAAIDSQNMKTVATSEKRGVDEAKGRMRHIVAYVLRNILSGVVHTANFHVAKSGIFAVKIAKKYYPSSKNFAQMPSI